MSATPGDTCTCPRSPFADRKEVPFRAVPIHCCVEELLLSRPCCCCCFVLVVDFVATCAHLPIYGRCVCSLRGLLGWGHCCSDAASSRFARRLGFAFGRGLCYETCRSAPNLLKPPGLRASRLFSFVAATKENKRLHHFVFFLFFLHALSRLPCRRPLLCNVVSCGKLLIGRLFCS